MALTNQSVYKCDWCFKKEVFLIEDLKHLPHPKGWCNCTVSQLGAVGHRVEKMLCDECTARVIEYLNTQGKVE